jgi:lipopolysaccharide exporter
LTRTPAGAETHTSPGGSLRSSAASGMVWQGASYLFGKVAVLATTLVLARLLVPEQFGLVALAMVFVTYADSIADLGVAQALVYLPRTAENARAALLSAVGFGLALAGGVVLAAPAIGELFGEPDVVPLIRLLSLSLLAGAVASVPESLMRRDLQFRRLSSAAVARSVAVGAVSVVLAVLGFGAAALVWGTVAGSLVYVLATWWLVPARPDARLWRTRWASLRAVLGYGLPAAGGMLLAKLIFDIDYLIVGHELGAEALGYYTMAFRIPELLIINVFFVVSSVTFPLYSQARADPDRLQRGYLSSVRIQAAYGVCAGLGVAAVAPVLIPVLLGENWAPAVAGLVPLAVYAALRSLGAGANDVYKALGRPGLSVQISLLRLVVLVPTLVLATRWGFAGVAWAQAVAAAAFVVLMQGVALRVLGLRWSQLLRAAAPGIAAGIATGGAALLVVLFLPGPDVVILAVAVLAGILAGAATLQVTAPSLSRDMLQLLRRTRPPSS